MTVNTIVTGLAAHRTPAVTREAEPAAKVLGVSKRRTGPESDSRPSSSPPPTDTFSLQSEPEQQLGPLPPGLEARYSRLRDESSAQGSLVEPLGSEEEQQGRGFRPAGFDNDFPTQMEGPRQGPAPRSLGDDFQATGPVVPIRVSSENAFEPHESGQIRPGPGGDLEARARDSVAPSRDRDTVDVIAGPAVATLGESSGSGSEVQRLQRLDRSARTAVRAYQNAARHYVKIPPQHRYERGPDNERYVVESDVKFNTAEVPGDADATLRKAQMIKRAVSSGGGGGGAAAQASMLEQQAKRDIAQDKRDGQATEAALVEARQNVAVQQEMAPAGAERPASSATAPAPVRATFNAMTTMRSANATAPSTSVDVVL